MNVRFTIMDIVKSIGTAEKNGKWYQGYLDRGGRWVTIKEGPLEGRHILIDGHGYIVGGRGIPKKVIDKLNGGHIDHTFGKYEHTARHNAVDETHKELGEQKITDRKGTWTFHHVSRSKHDDRDGRHEYSFYVSHEKLPGMTGEGWGMVGGIPMYQDDDIEKLKSRIKGRSGYTPDKATLEAMMEHFNKLKDAYAEQDQHYRDSDKEPHKKTVEELYQTALERAKKGEEPGTEETPYRRSNNKDHEKYLTKAEQEKLREAQKHIRGNSQHDYSADSYNNKVEDYLKTLGGFSARLWHERVQHEKKLEAERKDKERKDRLARLDTDVDFRKLAAHALDASKEKRSGDSAVELAHRLFGYTQSGEAHREKYGKLRELMEKNGMGGNIFDAGELVSLAKEYEKNGGTLPAVTAPHERQAGKLYYGDRVTNGWGASKVSKVGQKYVHVDSGSDREWKKEDTTHHILADKNADASTAEEHAENVMKIFHNHGDVIHGHHMTLESAVRILRHKRRNNISSIVNTLQQRAKNHPEQAEGIRMILDEHRRQELPGLISSTEKYNPKLAETLKEELARLGGAREDKKHTDIEWKEGRNPYEKPAEPEPAPAPTPTPVPAPKPPKGEKAPKLGYGDGATMHVPGSKDTFKHIKQLKHVHGGSWNGEKTRWEFQHEHGSDGHKALESYAKANGLTLNLHDGSEGAGEATPTPAGEPSNVGGKVGKVTIGGNTYPHRYALKTDHGATWNKDSKAWEVHGVAHGSDKHKALQAFAKDRGLTADHEHDEKAPEEPQAAGRDFENMSFSDFIKNPPTREEVEAHHKERGYDSGRADETMQSINELKSSPHLHPHAEEYLNSRRAVGSFNPLDRATRLLYKAKEGHSEAEAERKRKEQEKEQEEARRRAIDEAQYPRELHNADLSYLQKNPPTLEELQNFYRSRAEAGAGHPAGYVSGLDLRVPKQEAADRKAKEVYDALREYLSNPKLHGPMGEYMLDRMRNQVYASKAVSGGALLDRFPEHLKEAKLRAASSGYTSKIGAKIELSPEDIVNVRGIKGAGTGPAHRIKVVDPISKRLAVHYVPTKWAHDVNRIAQLVPSIGQDGTDYIHHILSGKDPSTFDPDARSVKATTKFQKFAPVPDKAKELDGYMDNAKGDLLAHGASDVAFTTKGTKAQRAKTAHIIATGFRALHHMLGGNLPPVAVTIGPTYSRALAHYSPGGRSIVIDPDKGQNSFFHEFGHFLDDAMHDFRRSNIGSRMAGDVHNPIGNSYDKDYHPQSPMAVVGKAIKETDTWKKRKEDTDPRWRHDPKYRSYFNSDIESFARFFSQWAGHEGRKRGYELPSDLADPKETEFEYGEHYTPEELDRVGEVLKKVLKDKGLLKGLFAFLDALGTLKPFPQRYVIRA